MISMKIDTQGMSFGDGKSSKSIQEQRDAIPPAKFTQVNLLSDSLKEELRQLINEVLDDFPEDTDWQPDDDGLDYEVNYYG
jgi:hypothetical protein